MRVPHLKGQARREAAELVEISPGPWSLPSSMDDRQNAVSLVLGLDAVKLSIDI